MTTDNVLFNLYIIMYYLLYMYWQAGKFSIEVQKFEGFQAL